MSSIYTLVNDIHTLLKSKQTGWFDDNLAESFSKDMAVRLQGQLGENVLQKPRLRLSQMGPRCPRALWYSIHHPELAEPLPPWAEIKFAYGHIIEGLAIALAKASGHLVQGEQDELELDGVLGHRDCIIDGCTVDVKSASSISFQKFKGNFELHDSFGYLDQLDSYCLAACDDPLVTVKDRGYLLVIDKTLGHMHVYEHNVTSDRCNAIKSRIAKYKEIIRGTNAPPCTCRIIPDGASGNIRLDFKASYSPYKYCCFPRLRSFAYANGPVDLVKVVRVPDVKEIFRANKHILH